jgi:hypothetical protein
MASDQEMLDRIAKLSSAIEQQKNIRGGAGRGGYIPNSRGAYRSRGGGHMSLHVNPTTTSTRPPITTNNNVYYSVNKPYIRPQEHVSHNRKLVLNGTQSQPLSFRPPPISFRPPAYRPPLTSMYRPLIVPATTLQPKSHHRKLIINHKGNNKTNNTMVKSIDAVTGRKQVAIDGVDFVVKGKKLIRKDLFDSNATKSNFMTSVTNAPKVLIRRTVKR